MGFMQVSGGAQRIRAKFIFGPPKSVESTDGDTRTGQKSSDGVTASRTVKVKDAAASKIASLLNRIIIIIIIICHTLFEHSASAVFIQSWHISR
jgi:hypothetical protein